MCGVFGAVGPGIIKQDTGIIKQLGMISQLRGMDGAGVFQTRSVSYKAHNHKYSPSFEDGYKTGNDWNTLLFDIDDIQKHPHLLESPMVDVIMGHVRAATVGRPVQSNAHPFVFPNLIGMHNGTLKDKEYREHKSKTDSELMFQDMQNKGIKPVLAALDKDSAYTVVIWERKDKVLSFATNGKRPLHFALLENRSVLYWASEQSFLKFVLDRAGLKYRMFKFEINRIYRMKPQLVCQDTGKFLVYENIFEEKAAEPAQSLRDKQAQADADFRGTLDAARVAEEAAEQARVQRELEAQKTRLANQQNFQLPESQENKEPKNAPSVMLKSGVVMNNGGGTVVPFAPPYRHNPKPAVSQIPVQHPVIKSQANKEYGIKSFYLSCVCGKDKLNLADAYECKQGTKGYPKYLPEVNKFECQTCDSNKERKTL